jgi:hypothetical protein
MKRFVRRATNACTPLQVALLLINGNAFIKNNIPGILY